MHKFWSSFRTCRLHSCHKRRSSYFLTLLATAAFRDLNIASGEGSQPLAAVNARDNQPGGDAREAGIFRHVTVGDYRTVKFTSAAGHLWYTDAGPTISPTATFFLDESATSWTNVIKHAVCTVYGDWNGNGTVEASELRALQTAIGGGPEAYNYMMDGDCSGTLDNDDLDKFLANYGNNLNGGFLMGGGEALDGSEEAAEGAGADGVGADDAEEPVDYAELAGFLIERLSVDELAAFVAEATLTAAEHEGDGIGAELAELLAYLP